MNWEWFGYAGHFICADQCKFRMCTKVGRYLISTVGDMRVNGELQKIGCDRTFETFVFKAGPRCAVKDCGCRQPSIDGSEIDSLPAQAAGEAQANHLAMCRKYERKQEKKK